MATWDRVFSNGSNFGHWRGRILYSLDSQDVAGNYSHVSIFLQAFSDNGAYTQSGLWDGRLYINGSQVARSTPSTTIGSSPVTLTSYGGNLGHDANGNLNFNLGDYINAPVNEMTFAEFNWALPRIPLAPSINAATADQLKPTTARLGTEINNFGHGTSAACRFYYRVQGVGSYVATADQADAAGFNYFAVTGLKPGTTYEYYAYWYNNNGDVSTSGVQTFKTQSIAGMAPLLISLVS